LNAHWFSGTIRVATVLSLGSAIAPGVCEAAMPNKLLGALVGSVRDNAGVPQMGAMVQLFNRYEKPIEKAITNGAGEFGFEALTPDVYSIRVTLSSFMPALKRNIAITSGNTSVLAINLASVLSSVELVYSSPNSGALMSDDWKWVLRSSMATRPVLRIFDVGGQGTSSSASTAIFSDTRGFVTLSSGEGTPFTSSGNQPDLGTTFALATSLFGAHHLQIAGNIGYAAQSELPATGFRTSFSRSDMQGPAVKLTMQQVMLPNRPTSAVVGSSQGNAPALRTMSLTLIEHTELVDGIELEYGASLDSVTFIDRLNYVSPFARLTYHLGDKSRVQIGYSSGAPPVELLQSQNEVRRTCIGTSWRSQCCRGFPFEQVRRWSSEYRTWRSATKSKPEVEPSVSPLTAKASAMAL
jgi:carboxypeptidase family protein